MSDYRPAASGGASGPRAGFWSRFAATIVDGLILGVPLEIVERVLGLASGLSIAVNLVAAIIYFGFFEGSPSGQTPGKRALGIRVIDFASGGTIGHGRAGLRYVVSIASSLVIFIGYLWMLWDREKQTWHDKAVNAVVVPVAAYPVDRWP